jgi:hypothetical protein
MSRLPVRAIIFLAAPHRGLNIDALQTLVMGQASEGMINELRADSPTLRELTNRFRDIVEDNIDLLTCYEQRPTKTVVKVTHKNPSTIAQADLATGCRRNMETGRNSCDNGWAKFGTT